MTYKRFLFLSLILSLSIFIIGCTQGEALPIKLTLEESIKEIIISKGDNYNFLDDSIYIDHMNNLVERLSENKKLENINYKIGNLDDDNIPEIVIFNAKNPDRVEDEGSLEVYSFNGEQYTLLDKISMNFDTSNYQMEIGKLSKSTNGLLLNNNVGAHSGVTYGFILENGKLKSILNDKKMSLISIYTENQIKDIDEDGVLEFSIYTVDPETEDISTTGSDKMTLWYKWNGKDSGEIVKVQRKELSQDPTDKDTYRQLEESIETDFSNFISLLTENKEKLSRYDTTMILDKYIKKLDALSYDKNIEIENLFSKYQGDKNFDYIFSKYVTTIDKLNDPEYLNREKVLKDEIVIKEHLIKNINLGYKLVTQEGMYYYLIDYKKLVNLFGSNLTREYYDYLEILALNTQEQFLNDGSLVISNDNLVNRILLVESFKMVYPYSNLYEEIDNIYKLYFKTYIYGDNHNPNFDTKTGKIKEETLKELESRVEQYEYTNFADILSNFLNWIEANNNIIDDSIREKLDNRLN